MARARGIKPGFYKNEDLSECSIWARYIFPGLWMLADREGRLEDRPKRIKNELLGFDSIEVIPLINELEDHGFILRYQNPDGKFIQITKFKENQSPHYSEKPSVIKPPGFRESPPLHDTKIPRALPESGVHHDTNTPGILPESSQNHPGFTPSSRGGRNPLTPDCGLLTADSRLLTAECGSSAPDSGNIPEVHIRAPSDRHTLPEKFQKTIEARPELDAVEVYRKFCNHYPPKKRSATVWENWVRNEKSGNGTNGADNEDPAKVPGTKAFVLAMAHSLGIEPWSQMEQWGTYAARVEKAAKQRH